jgi:ecdysteroid kinase
LIESEPELREIRPEMKSAFQTEILRKLEGRELVEQELIQELWSGYGTIRRYRVRAPAESSVIVKHVRPPRAPQHPRGWDGERSHLRKLRSYAVESAWYRDWSHRCGAACRTPECYALAAENTEFHIALEDLHASGFPLVLQRATLPELKVCIAWLAHFHATFMGVEPRGLWEVGTYWHLDTRPDELARVQDEPLREAAKSIDRQLKSARFQTIVHGDAKLANFCFAADRRSVAAVDFQYVGGGCGMKDLVYLLGGCLSGKDCSRLESSLLDHYFETLRTALTIRSSDLDTGALEAEWRALYAPAWADFHRFLKGWSPDHWKLSPYGEELTRSVVDEHLGRS